ncbi:MAG: type VII toxin-antitoxin system HepT family RNase toxin [Thermoanaerobaculia bacterium]
MTATGVRLKLVRERLQAMTAQIGALRALPQASKEEFLADRRNPDAAESNLRRALEALFDVARHLLSKAHGLGTLEYKEVARLAGEKGLVTDPELQRRFVEVAGFRNRLTHYYHEVTPEELYEVTTIGIADLEALREALRTAAAQHATADDETTDTAQ